MILRCANSLAASPNARCVGRASWCAWVCITLLCVAEAHSAEAAPATQPAAVSAIESIPLRRGAAPNGPGKPASSLSNGGTGAWRVLGALVIVIGAILLLRWGGKRLLGIQTPGGSPSAIRVLSRQVVGPRQQLMLVQIGRRILLVANSGAQMNSLCELTDAEEVASLLAQVNERKAAPAARPFWSYFRREQSQFADTDPAAEPARHERTEPELATTREEIHGLLDKVQAISRSFKKA